MSHEFITYLLSEIATVRFRCKLCQNKSKAVIEVPISELDRLFQNGTCPICQERILPRRPPEEGEIPFNPFVLLAKAWEGFCNQENFTLELVATPGNLEEKK